MKKAERKNGICAKRTSSSAELCVLVEERLNVKRAAQNARHQNRAGTCGCRYGDTAYDNDLAAGGRYGNDRKI